MAEPTRPDVLELTQQLIAIESHRLCEGREAAIGKYLLEWLTARGIEASLQLAVGERANLIARIPGGEGPSLMLCGHLDTVPAGDMAGAFRPKVEEGVLWGRGACDMKGAVAAMACTLSEVKRAMEESSASLAGDLLFVGTVDEETGGLGVKALVDSGLRTTYAVVGEPTSLRVALAHKGACFVRIALTGQGAHGSCPEEGVSAVSYAARVVRAIEEELRPRLVERTHPLLGSSTVNVGRVCGGTQPNIVAERCEIDIDRRTVPGDDAPLEEIVRLVEGVCSGVDGLGVEIDEMEMTSVVPHTALETPASSPVAEAALAAASGIDTSPSPVTPVGVTYWTDGGHLSEHGIETIILGPGDIADAHGPRDRVAVRDLEAAVRIYRRIVASCLGA